MIFENQSLDGIRLPVGLEIVDNRDGQLVTPVSSNDRAGQSAYVLVSRC